MRNIKKILIANRGEIAIRIIKAAKEMYITTVAVYSDVDKHSLHVQLADEAIALQGNSAAETYISIDKIISAAKKSGADAIHPGYGFLAENAAFSKRVEDEGLIFIGPSAETIRLMGDKIEAKKLAKDCQVPLVPGTEEAIEKEDEAVKIAGTIGYPVMIKAKDGGGGKGMRIVYSEAELREQLGRAQSEAQSAFGNASVFIEKFIEEPKHIEVQLLADKHGNTVHLYHRDCSVQRRHQKVIEEAPVTSMPKEVLDEMAEKAVALAKNCNYFSAGTVEFIADKNNNFYFLEMNTRLQVEHPVSEWITGIDLVKWQIDIAKGLPLSFSQEDIQQNGHAIELRVYAEDPENKFLPDTGTLEEYSLPDMKDCRVDNGYRKGDEIPVFYDPMIAKLITYGETRKVAIENMLRAIEKFNIKGIKTTLSLGDFVMRHPSFQEGSHTTKFIDQYYHAEIQEEPTDEELAIALATAYHIDHRHNAVYFPEQKDSNWFKNRK